MGQKSATFCAKKYFKQSFLPIRYTALCFFSESFAIIKAYTCLKW